MKPIQVVKKCITNRSYSIILLLVTVFGILINNTVCLALPGEFHNRKILYPSVLFDQGDYYRAITEFLRLKENDLSKADNSEINLYLLKSYLKLKQYSQIEILAGSILENKNQQYNPDLIQKTGFILSLSYLETGDFGKAEETWQRYLNDIQSPLFPLSYKVEEEIDPKKATFYSTILPGTGLVLTGEYGKAAVAFFVNALFIAGTYQSFNQEQYGLASLFCFFEISFYFGGRNASYESAINYNNKLKRDYFRSWKESQLDYIFR